jgi:putative oxidoreductase
MNEKVVLGIRMLLGVGLVFFGANKFFHWVQPPVNEAAGEFMMQLSTAGGGYIMTVVALVEIIAGISFLANKFVPLMAVVLFPVMLNAFLFHLFLDVSGVAGALVFMIFNIVIMFANKSAYSEMLKA